jgi:hypothetical protein
MMALGNVKTVWCIRGAAPTAAETTTSDTIDTLGFDEMLLVLTGTTSNNATNNPATLKLQQSDITDATGFADIAKYVGDGASGFTIPASPTATGLLTFANISVSLVGYKRYFRLLVSPLTTQTFNAVALLGRAEAAPDSAAEAGTAVLVA